jgi:1-acyl-sn-glycerol-3-phosphate acyltransferase
MTDESNTKSKSLDELLAVIGDLIVKSDSAIRIFKDDMIDDIDERLATINKSIAGEEGIDPFGMEPETVRKTAIGAAFLYKLYFRCITRGIENVPDGPVIIAANHGGQIPIDGVVITTALMLEKDPPRFLRSMMDRWVPSLPFVSTFFSRVGVTVGTTENAQRLLSRGEAVLVFPEGIGAISKTVDQAYHLQKFSRGFVRIAISSKTPIVPLAVVGSEEQYPAFFNLKRVAKLLGIPAMPIWPQMAIPLLGLLPLPVRYRIQFGTPMYFEGDPDDDDAVIQVMADQVASRIADMLTTLRKERKSIFL